MQETFPNPLEHLHAAANAEMQSYGPLEVVSTFGEAQAEYAALRKACGMMDLPHRGILEITGADRLPFLNNLITNELYNKHQKTQLQADQGIYSFLLNLKGRVVTDLRVLERGERTLLEMDIRLVGLLRQ